MSGSFLGEIPSKASINLLSNTKTIEKDRLELVS